MKIKMFKESYFLYNIKFLVNLIKKHENLT